MYLKLALRNARRSLGDYLLYLATFIVLSAVMMYSNLLSFASSLGGLQASSVPLLISIIMVVMFTYINNHTLRRRSKEFATYILLGMERKTMAAVFFVETLVLGTLGFVLGAIIGGLAFALSLSLLPSNFVTVIDMAETNLTALRDTFFYFIAFQIFSLAVCVRKIGKLQISSLLSEDQKNQSMKGKARPVAWGVVFAVCIIATLVLIEVITGGHGDTAMLLGMNTILAPVIVGMLSFYKTVFHGARWVREKKQSALYQGSRLYLVSQLLSKVTSNIALNTVLSLCLLFASLTFAVGIILPSVTGDLMPSEQPLWLSFAEIGLCIVFLAVYFSILSVRLVIEAKENRFGFRVMEYLGTSRSYRRGLLLKEIALRFLLPASICLVMLLLSTTQLNDSLNTVLSTPDMLLSALATFAGCFALLYAGYFLVTYRLCSSYLLKQWLDSTSRKHQVS